MNEVVNDNADMWFRTGYRTEKGFRTGIRTGMIFRTGTGTWVLKPDRNRNRFQQLEPDWNRSQVTPVHQTGPPVPDIRNRRTGPKPVQDSAMHVLAKLSWKYDLVVRLLSTTNQHLGGQMTYPLPGNCAAENLYNTRKCLMCYSRSAVDHMRSSCMAHSIPWIEHNTFSHTTQVFRSTVTWQSYLISAFYHVM